MMSTMNIVTSKTTDFSLKSLVVEAVSDVLADPDYGLKLKASFVKKLNVRKRNFGKGLTLSEAKKKYS